MNPGLVVQRLFYSEACYGPKVSGQGKAMVACYCLLSDGITSQERDYSLKWIQLLRLLYLYRESKLYLIDKKAMTGFTHPSEAAYNSDQGP